MGCPSPLGLGLEGGAAFPSCYLPQPPPPCAAGPRGSFSPIKGPPHMQYKPSHCTAIHSLPLTPTTQELYRNLPTIIRTTTQPQSKNIHDGESNTGGWPVKHRRQVDSNSSARSWKQVKKIRLAVRIEQENTRPMAKQITVSAGCSVGTSF
jgi:hypothetical protein